MIEYAAPGHHLPQLEEQSPLRRGGSMVWQSIAAMFIVGIAALLGMLAMGSFVGAAFAMLGGMMLFAAARIAFNARRRDALTVLSHIETAVRMKLPLATSLRLWSSSEKGAAHQLLKDVTSLVEAGAPIADALRRAGAELPLRTIDRLEASEHAGRLDRTITELLDEQRGKFKHDATHAPFMRLYALILLIAIPSTIVLMTIFVIPKFEQILKDFRLPMPMATRLVIAVAEVLAPAMAIVAVLLFVALGRNAFAEITARRSRSRRRAGFFRTLLDHLRWITPILNGLDRDRGMADVCQTIAEAVEQCRPLPSAVAEASQPHLNAVLAARVNTWAQLLADGLPTGVAADRAGMPALLVGMLGSSRDVPDVAAACRFLERYYRSRFSRTYTLLREAGVPLLALAAGAVVLLIAMAILSPMTAMLDKVSVQPIFRTRL